MGRMWQPGPGCNPATFVRACAAACLISLAAAPALARQTIRIHGSDTMVILNREWASRYAQIQPDIEIDVHGGGSNLGITALLEGKADIAAASRAMKAEEIRKFKQRTGAAPRRLVVALDGIAVYVHETNPVTRLTVDQLRGVLTGKLTNWNQVGGANRQIHIYNRDKNSGTRVYMREHVLKGKAFAKGAMDVSSTALITTCVSRNPRGIGYGGVAYAENARLIRLAADGDDAGHWPSRDEVASGKYPLSRPLHFYVNPKAIDADLQAFIDWVLSEQGQRVVTFVGYFPAPEKQPGDHPDPGPDPDGPAQDDPHDDQPLQLTPANMQRYGFNIAAEFEDDGPADRGRMNITLDLGLDAAALAKIDAARLHLGQDAIVPLTLDEDGKATFSLRRAMLQATSVHLVEQEADDAGRTYVIALDAFVAGD